MKLLQILKKLEDSTKNSGFNFEYIHTGPVIRREDVFAGLSIDERRKLLFKMLNFIASSPIVYEMAVVNRKEAPDKISLSGRLIFPMLSFGKQNHKNIVYYRQLILSVVWSC